METTHLHVEDPVGGAERAVAELVRRRERRVVARPVEAVGRRRPDRGPRAAAAVVGPRKQALVIRRRRRRRRLPELIVPTRDGQPSVPPHHRDDGDGG